MTGVKDRLRQAAPKTDEGGSRKQQRYHADRFSLDSHKIARQKTQKRHRRQLPGNSDIGQRSTLLPAGLVSTLQTNLVTFQSRP